MIGLPHVEPPENPTAPARTGPDPRQLTTLGQKLLTDRSALLLLAQLGVALVALLANILASRTLQAHGRGDLALLLQLAYLGSLGVVLGTDRSLVTVYADMPVHEVTRAQLRLLARPATTALALATVAVWGLPLVGLGGWRMQLTVTALFLVSNAFVRATRAIAIASHRQRDFLVVTLVEQLLLLSALALLAVAGVNSVSAWVSAYLVTALGPTAIYLARWARTPATAPATAHRVPSTGAGRRGQARREGLQLLPSSLANTGMLRLDRVLLGTMASTTALGYYASVGTFTELLTWPLIAFADNRTGAWRGRHDAGQLNLRAPLLAALAFVLVGSVVTAAFTAFLLPLLGPAFAEASGLIPPLVAAAAVLGLGKVVLALLIARRRNVWASASDSTGFLVSLIAYVTLIPSHGSTGAAWGSLIGYGACLTVGLAALIVPERPSRQARPSRQQEHPSRQARPSRPVTVDLPMAAPLRGQLSGTLLFLTALIGRYTLDRAGYESLAWLDLREVGLAVACVLVAVELHARGGTQGTQPAGWLVAAMLLFGYQILSAGWAPPGADSRGVVDLLTLAALTLAIYLHARTWPDRAGRQILWLLWVTSIVFGLGAFLVTGPGAQGRYAAFGGGPNVFVRIEVLGLIAAATLVWAGASRHVLWSVPLLLAGAVMSGSRGGLLAAAVVGLVAPAIARRTRSRDGARTPRRVTTAAVAGALAATGAGAAATVVLVDRLNLPGTQLLRDRFVGQTLAKGYLSERPAIFEDAIRLALDNPLTGTGLGGFRVLVGERLRVEHAHNYLLALAAESGAISLVLLGTVVTLWLRALLRARPWNPVTTGLIVAASFIALAGLTSGDYYDSRFAWCCAAVGMAGLASRDAEGLSPARPPASPPSPRSSPRSSPVVPGPGTGAGQDAADGAVDGAR